MSDFDKVVVWVIDASCIAHANLIVLQNRVEMFFWSAKIDVRINYMWFSCLRECLFFISLINFYPRKLFAKRARGTAFLAKMKRTKKSSKTF